MPNFGSAELAIIFFMLPFVWLLTIVPFWKICSKAGLSPWLSILMVVPLANIIVPFVVAFSDWPAIRRQANPGGGGGIAS